MKKLVSIFALISLASFAFAADDIETVNNGKTPAGTPMTLKLVEDLRLGPDQGDAYIWPSAAVIVDADDKGRMYVLDIDGKRVMQYAEDGTFLKEIGGPGQGPGEFMFLGYWSILADGGGVGFEPAGPSSSLSYFDADMNFVEEKQLKTSLNMVQQAVIAPSGTHAMVFGINMNPPKMKMTWLLVDLESEKEIEISSYSVDMPNQETFTSPDKFSDFMADNFQQVAKGKAAFATFSPNGKIFTAVSRQYQIHSYDKNLVELEVVKRDYQPIPQSEEEIMASIDTIVEGMKASMPPQVHHLVSKTGIAKAVEKADFPPVKYPINGLNTLEDGSLLVVHDVDLLDKYVLIDIFDKNGTYLGNYKHHIDGFLDMAFVAKFKNGCMYRVVPTEDDENELVRYRYSVVPAE